jgi:hypothetical protein
MNSDIIFLAYLVQFLLEWEMFQTKLLEKSKTHVLCSVTFSRKSYRWGDNVEKYEEPLRPQMTMRRMRFACRVTKEKTHAYTYNI